MDIRKYLLKTNVIYQTGKIFNSFIKSFFDLITFFVGILFIIKGKLTLGNWFAYNSVSTSFVSYLLVLLGSFQIFKQNSVIIERIEEITKISEENINNKSNLCINEGKIDLYNISFSYNKHEFVLNNLSLNFKSKTINSIIGKNGSGKTTISKLLNRLYEINSGKISIDGIDIREYNLNYLRKNIVVMNQKIELFNESIKYNISLGLSCYSDKQLIDAAILSNSYNFIIKLPKSFDTIVGSGGVNLSIGQEQKILLARVLIREPKIIIFDEPTSHLDSETKEDFIKILKKLKEKSTIILLSHDKKLIEESDFCYFL